MPVQDYSVTSFTVSPFQAISVQTVTNRPLKYIIAGLLLLTITINLSFYNTILIRNYNTEVICISKGDKQCVIGTFPCTENGVTYRYFNEINFQTIEFNLLLIVSMIVIISTGIIATKLLLKKESSNEITQQKRSKLNGYLGLMAFMILTNMIFYNIIMVRANYVLEMQNIGCYTLVNPTIFSWIIMDNFMNVLFSVFGTLLIIISVIGISYIDHRESTNSIHSV